MADEPEFSVTSTEPIKLDQPYKRLRRAKQTVVLIFVAIFVCAFVSSYITSTLEDRSRATNRAVIMQQQKAAAKQIEQLREFLCDLSANGPHDKTITEWRLDYHCVNASPAPSNP